MFEFETDPGRRPSVRRFPFAPHHAPRSDALARYVELEFPRESVAWLLGSQPTRIPPGSPAPEPTRPRDAGGTGRPALAAGDDPRRARSRSGGRRDAQAEGPNA